MKVEMVIKIKDDTKELTMESDEIETLPCVKCLIRPMCSNTPFNHFIKCHILAEFIKKYSKSVGVDIEVIDSIAAPLYKQLLYIYNKINGGSK